MLTSALFEGSSSCLAHRCFPYCLHLSWCPSGSGSGVPVHVVLWDRGTGILGALLQFWEPAWCSPADFSAFWLLSSLLGCKTRVPAWQPLQWGVWGAGLYPQSPTLPPAGVLLGHRMAGPLHSHPGLPPSCSSEWHRLRGHHLLPLLCWTGMSGWARLLPLGMHPAGPPSFSGGQGSRPWA